MKCSVSKKQIYLYKDLSFHEQRQLHDHLASCVACRELFSRVRDDHAAAVNLFAAVAPVSTDRLTDRIIADIRQRQEHRRSTRYGLFVFLQPAPIRYALAVLSMVLVFFFATETLRVTVLPAAEPAHSRGIDSQQIKLNSRRYYQEQKKPFQSGLWQPSPSMSFYNCIKSCRIHAESSPCGGCKRQYEVPAE